MLHSAQAEAEGIIRDLKKAESSKGKEVLEARHRLDKKLDDMAEPMVKSQNATEGAALTKVTLGQTVMIRPLGCTAPCWRCPIKNGDVQLQVGLMKMKQPLSALRSAGKTDAPKKEKGGKRTVGNMAARQVPLEIDVRGQLPEEAIDNVDKYLDDCMMAGLSEVSIVHGKGTGVLRSEISQHLRRHPHVAGIPPRPLPARAKPA